jgi:hypothetical protein
MIVRDGGDLAYVTYKVVEPYIDYFKYPDIETVTGRSTRASF